MRGVTFRPLSLPACLVCTLDASSSVQSFPEPDPTISNKHTPHKLCDEGVGLRSPLASPILRGVNNTLEKGGPYATLRGC